MTVENDCSSCARGTRMSVQISFWFIHPKCFIHAGWEIELNFINCVGCPFKQPDIIDTHRQDIKSAYSTQQRDKRLDMEFIGNDQKFVKFHRQAIRDMKVI